MSKEPLHCGCDPDNIGATPCADSVHTLMHNLWKPKTKEVLDDHIEGGWAVVRDRGRPIRLECGERDGMAIEINRSRKSITVYGWYDGCIGLEPREISLEAINRLMQGRNK